MLEISTVSGFMNGFEDDSPRHAVIKSFQVIVRSQ